MTINEGDRVAYSREFCRSIGEYTGELPMMRGKVMRIEEYDYGLRIAVVNWESDDGSSKINCANLWPADKLYLEPN